MKSGTASGMQIAFFTFAVVLLAAPLSKWMLAAHPWSPEVAAMLDKSLPFLLAGALLLAFPNLRRLCDRELSIVIPPERRAEVVIVSGAQLITPFAWAGAVALWYWAAGGEAGLAQRMRMLPSHDAEMTRAFVGAEMVRIFVVAGILAPLTEELVFRGMLYRAWERQWGWLPAMIASSGLFALYHGNFAPAFVGGVISVCLLRRAGSIWAPILAHSAYNIVSWYPLTGKHVFPRELHAPGDLTSWPVQLACLLVIAIALPFYVWLSRHRHDPEPFPPTAIAHDAVPQ